MIKKEEFTDDDINQYDEKVEWDTSDKLDLSSEKKSKINILQPYK